MKKLTLHKKERQQQDHSFRSNQSIILFIYVTGKNEPTQKWRVLTSSTMLIQLSLTFRLIRQDSMLKFWIAIFISCLSTSSLLIVVVSVHNGRYKLYWHYELQRNEYLMFKRNKGLWKLPSLRSETRTYSVQPITPNCPYTKPLYIAKDTRTRTFHSTCRSSSSKTS